MPKLTHGERQQQAAQKLEEKRLRREARDRARLDRVNLALSAAIKKSHTNSEAKLDRAKEKAEARFERAKANGRVAVMMDPGSNILKISVPPPKPPKPTLPVRSNYASWNDFEAAVHSQAEKLKLKLTLPPKRKEETRGVERVTSHEREAM